MARNQALPTYDFLAPTDADSPPRAPLRETLRVSRAAPPTDPSNAAEDLRGRVKKLEYELDTLREEREMERLQHQQELRDIQTKAEEDFQRAQTSAASIKSNASRYESLVKELQESQTRLENERQDVERRLRTSQDKATQLQEEVDEAKEDLAIVQREHEHKYKALQAEQQTLKESLDETRVDLEAKIDALQTTQRKLAQKESEVGELETEVLRLKAQAGDSDTLALIKKELSEQVAHIKKLEALNREQHAELKQLRKTNHNVGVLEEEKRDLVTRLQVMSNLQQALSESQLQREILENERKAWTSYLESQTSNDMEMQFQTPEDLARAFVQQRLENADLSMELGRVKPELSVKEESIQVLKDEKFKLQAELQALKASGPPVSNNADISANSGAADSKARIRLQRQKELALKEVEYLRAQLSMIEVEEGEMQPEKHDSARAERIKQLEGIVDEYRKEVEVLQKDLSSLEPSLNVTAPATAGQKRSLETDENDERLGELRRKNKQLQEEIKEFQKRYSTLETDFKAQHSQLRSLKAASRTRVLELRSNPTADAEALKLSTVRTLREANAELLARLEGRDPSPTTSVPLATLNAARDEIAELTHTVAEREKRIKRLKQIWTAKSLEFREAVASVLGWKIDFLPNGRARVTSMFYPGDEETGENSILFDGENGTMKVSGGPQSAFANEIRDNITFWVEERKEIPCFLAALTLEFWERNTRAAK